MRKALAYLMMIALVCLMFSVPVMADQGSIQSAKDLPADGVIMGQVGEITENNVRLRQYPGLSAPVLMYLHQGYFVQISYDTAYVDDINWRRVVYEGVSGWVATQYLYMYGSDS